MAQLRPVTALPGSEAHGTVDVCPTCQQTIPHELSQAVSSRIARFESERHAALEAERKRIEAEAAQRTSAAIAEARHQAEALVAARLAEVEGRREAAEAELRAQKLAYEAETKARLAEAREAMERDRIAAVHAEQAKAFEGSQKLMAKIAELQRQLESKTAQELGEGPEIDLFEMLKAEFPEDRISRVERGAAGADVIHDVHHNGRHVGRIVYDSKNRSAWRNEYTAKLRQDQTEARADHAVLASKVFPAGQRDIHVQDGVVVVTPGRVLVIAGMLRRHIVQTSLLKASNEARMQKTEALYAYIVSEDCHRLIGSIAGYSGDMAELDRKEQKAHEAVWKKRGDLIRQVQRAQSNLTFEIERIIGVAGNRASPDEDEG